MEMKQRVQHLIADVERACIKYKLNMTIYDGKLAFVDQESRHIVATWVRSSNSARSLNMAGSKEVFYLKIGSEADRVTVASILFRNGYSVQPVKQKKDGRSNEYLVKYWIGETMVEGAEIPK